MRRLCSFPDPVNETSARLVAAGVVVQALVFLVVREGWLLVPLVYGFLARVATGPSLSPLGQLVTRGIVPRLPPVDRFVPGPPKRFAQGVGLLFSVGASVAWLLDVPAASYALLAALVIAATLESVFAVCLGCIAYRFLWECDECDDISERLRAALAARESVVATN
jgi:hypothetical protein